MYIPETVQPALRAPRAAKNQRGSLNACTATPCFSPSSINDRAKADDSESYCCHVYRAPSQATRAISFGVILARLARAWTTVGQSGRRPPCFAMRSSRLRLRQLFRARTVIAARPTPPQTAAVVFKRLLGMTFLIVFYRRYRRLAEVSGQKKALALETLYAMASRF